MEPVFYVVTDGHNVLFDENIPIMFKMLGEAQEWLESDAGKISCERFGFKEPLIRPVTIKPIGW